MKIRARAIRLALSFAVIFSCVAVAQFIYVRHQTYRTIRSELQDWANELAAAAVSEGKWDIQGYQNMAPLVPNSYVVTSDGLLVDVEGFIRGLIPSVKKPEESLYESPQRRTTDIGEKWLLFGRRLAGGCVIVGISDPDKFKDSEALLRANADKFGSTLEEAKRLTKRRFDWNVDYAVIADSGALESASGGVPLKTDTSFLRTIPDATSPVAIEGKLYLVVVKPIRDSSGNQIGMVIVPKDVTSEQRALHQQTVFNTLVAGTSWLMCLLIPLSYLIFDEIQRRRQEMSIEEALRTGENQIIEFKRGFIADILAREIAAFANTISGNIFLGIDDAGHVVGLSEADAYQRGELLRKIRDITSGKISPRVSTQTAFLTYESKTVLRIFVPRGEQPLYAVEGLFYIRQQNSAEKATPQQIVAIVNKFAR